VVQIAGSQNLSEPPLVSKLWLAWRVDAAVANKRTLCNLRVSVGLCLLSHLRHWLWESGSSSWRLTRKHGDDVGFDDRRVMRVSTARVTSTTASTVSAESAGRRRHVDTSRWRASVNPQSIVAQLTYEYELV
jgi:hypothetical protein